MNNLVIWGAKGHAKVLFEILEVDYKLIAIFDNNNAITSPFLTIPIYYGMGEFIQWLDGNRGEKIYYSVAIGGSNGKIRRNLGKELKSNGLHPVNLFHKTSYISRNVSYGEGLQMLANSFVGVECKVGDYVICNSNSSIDHECSIGNGVHIAPGAILAGCVSIGDDSFIGTNATILPHIRIGSNVIVGAGSVVTRDVPDNIIVVGNPAKFLKFNNKL